MDCPKCGREVPANAMFCYSCGAQMELPPLGQQDPAKKLPLGQAPAWPPPARRPTGYSSRAYSRPANASPYWPYDNPNQKRPNRLLILAINRLSALGGIFAALGFFLQWDRGSAKTGWDVFQMGISTFGNLGQLDLADANTITTLLRGVLMLGLGLIPLAALCGLLTLTGTRSSRLTAVAVSIFALLNLAALYTVILTFNKLPFSDLFKTLAAGWYLVVIGLLWMIFSPLFARKRQRSKQS